MHIENVRIKGFKRIDSLEFSPKSVNIVTGPNNSGKTTLLEAIDLLFNPRNITKWENNIDYLINSKAETASISCEYRTAQTSLAEFNSQSDSESGLKTRELAIRRPRDDEAINNFIDALLDIVQKGPDANYYSNRFLRRQINAENISDEFDEERFDELIHSSIKESIISICDEQDIGTIRDMSVILSIGGEEYPYVYLEENFYRNIREEIASEAADEAFTQLKDLSLRTEAEFDNLGQFRRLFSDLLIPRLGRGRFVDGIPTTDDTVFFGETDPISKNDINLSKNNGAVRLNAIEGYIKEKNIVRNLQDFSLELLVFEEDGEEYQVPYEFMGEGFKQIVTLLWELSKGEVHENVLLLEEAENHMHPGYVNKMAHRLVSFSMDRRIQMFITTHNMDFIESFFSPNLKDREERFLEENFQVLKMGRNYTEQIPYSEAKQDLESIHNDLRGL